MVTQTRNLPESYCISDLSANVALCCQSSSFQHLASSFPLPGIARLQERRRNRQQDLAFLRVAYGRHLLGRGGSQMGGVGGGQGIERIMAEQARQRQIAGHALPMVAGQLCE